MGQIVSDVTDVLDYKKSKKEAKTARQEILRQIAEDEATKSNLVKKALAAQRAKYGAGGMARENMTTGAVLKRLSDEAGAPYNEKRRVNMTKLQAVKNVKPTNLLKKLLSRFDDLVG